MVATKTIAKGDTRATGLRWLCNNGGTIYSATRRIVWPGAAAVIVSVVHIFRERLNTSAVLDGQVVQRITAFLFTLGTHEDPVQLAANRGISFNGCNLASQGFLFDDGDPQASPLAEMVKLLEAEPDSSERLFPFYGGDEINTDPEMKTRRIAIYFGTLSEAQAAQYPLLFDVVRRRVKPHRDSANRKAHRENWWLYGDPRPQLMQAIAGMERFLACVFVSKYLSFVWLPERSLVSHNVGVFATNRDEFFCVVQSRLHEAFAIELSSGLEDRPGYRPTDGFLPFPFPSNWKNHAVLHAAGKAYYECRAAIMIRNDEGLTKTYNRFHDPGERDSDILRLRELHDAMDRAVLDAYGWSGLRPTCEFLLDYEEDDDTESGKRRKPWRYRWPDEIRDEVLARLLALNAERAEAERLQGPSETVNRKGRRRAVAAPTEQLLFGEA